MTMSLLRTYVVLLAVTLIPALLQGQVERRTFSDVRVLEESNAGLTLEYTPVYERIDTIPDDGKTYLRICFRGMSDPLSADAGRPDLRNRAILTALPGRTGNVVSVVASDFETVSGFECVPVPSFVPRSFRYPSGRKYEEQREQRSGFSPATIASLDVPFEYGGVPAVCLRITPVQYDAATHTLRKYTRIVVHIDFGPVEAAVRVGTDVAWMNNSVVNPTSAHKWLQPRRLLSKIAAQNSVLSSGTWTKVEVKEDGMYKIDAKLLKAAGVDASTVGSLQNVRVFGGTGRTIASDLAADYLPDLAELSVQRVDANANGVFDEGDYVAFFGRGSRWWTDAGVSGDFVHHVNPYSNSNYYFVRIGSAAGAAREMSVVVRNETPAQKIDKTVGKVVFHEEKTNYCLSGLKWVSAVMNSGDKRTVTNKLSGYVVGTPVVYKYEMLARSVTQSAFTLEETGAPLSTLYQLPMYSWDPNESAYANVASDQINVVPSLTDKWSSLRVTFRADGGVGVGWISWIEILYQQQLAAVNDELLFTAPYAGTVAEFSLTGFSGNAVNVFDVTDPLEAKRLTIIPDQVLGSISFRDSLRIRGAKWYWAGTAATYRQPVSVQQIPNSNLRGGSNGADFIILTHKEFKDQALRLKTFKENLPGGNALTTMVVDVDTLYNEFGFGAPDPVAIRNFMRFTQSQWTVRPRYLLLFGDASVDYKSILGTDRSWVPTYETDYSMDQVGSYAYDDFYAILNPADDGLISLGIGRLPARSAEQARLFVDRLIAYESTPTFGNWKNLITIVADDNVVGTGEPDGADNLNNAETLAKFYVPLSFDIKKIYSGDYPAIFTSAGRRKPEVRAAIIDQVNRGSLILNYTGHGNPTVWAHESILTLDDVKTQFFNNDKLTFAIAATCDWGRFDEPGAQSSGEELLSNENGGGIAVFSALRPVLDGDNAELNRALYGNLLPQNIAATMPRIGDAIVLAKNVANNVDNKRKYHLLGDPTLRLAVPNLTVAIDSLNGKPLSSSNPDTIRALSQVVLNASVRTSGGTVMDSLQGSAFVTLYDAEQIRNIVDNGRAFTFTQPGGAIYKGTCSVVNGKIRATCFVPKDIAYQNKNGRIAMYMMSGSKDGRGATRDIIVGGTSSTTSTDRSGPAMSIYFDSRSFRPGDLVGENPTLIVDLVDSSGINAAGSGIGHRFEGWLDGSTNSIDLGDFYRGTLDSYQQGVIEYPMSGLEQGRHTLKVRAWDAYNNSSTAESDFSVASTGSLTIQNVFNIPNPAAARTNFTFQQNQPVSIDVLIKIYSVAGRLLQTIERFGLSERYVNIPWDCRDRDGDLLGNGVYLYRVMAKTSDGKYSSEATGKLAIAR